MLRVAVIHQTTIVVILAVSLTSCSTRKGEDDMGLLNKIFGKKNGVNEINPTSSRVSLSEKERQCCRAAKLTEQDGLLLKGLTNRPIEALMFENEMSGVEKPVAIGSLAPEDVAKEIVLDNLDRYKTQGKYIFIASITSNGYVVGITSATSDPYALMELAETNGLNYDIETKHIIEKYRKWDSEFGIIPIAIGFDFCECKIRDTHIDYKKLAAEVYELCPDVVDQGTETVEALEDEIKRTGMIYLWWD